MLRVNPLELNLGKDHGSRVWARVPDVLYPGLSSC